VPPDASFSTLEQTNEPQPIAVPSAYAQLLVLVLFVFLLFSDWVVLGGPMLSVRRALVAVLGAAALPFVVRHPRAVGRAVAAPPLVFFAAFLVLGLVLAPTALKPGAAALHALAFAGLTVFAVATAAAVPRETFLAVVRITLAVKLLGSLAVGLAGPRLAGSPLLGPQPGSLAYRHTLGGLFGNPNPLCDAAVLYLVLVACDLIERARRWQSVRRCRLLAGWYLVTVPVAAYLMWQSLSRSAWLALVIVGAAIGLMAQWRASRTVSPVPRRLMSAGLVLAALVGFAALLVWLDVSRGVIRPGGSIVHRLRHAVSSGVIFDTAERPQFWAYASEKIREKPWTGYGMVSTPSLYAARFQGRLEHAHNLELEAALYAGIPAGVLIALFTLATAEGAAKAFLTRQPNSLSIAATLLFLLVLAQVEPVILGSPYPSLLIVLALAATVRDSRAARPQPM
jgi:O-antigen ligase